MEKSQPGYQAKIRFSQIKLEMTAEKRFSLLKSFQTFHFFPRIREPFSFKRLKIPLNSLVNVYIKNRKSGFLVKGSKLFKMKFKTEKLYQ